ncbi:MAG: DUF4956 domain-containing protein [Candidatus Faecousia sp.]|nr:DUF4956 domain-containing protein [Candidatus Faecousia sp.]
MNKELLYYLTNDAGSLTLQEILLSFACAVVLGAVIFVSYRFCHTGAVYSAKFNVSLWMMTLVTTLIMCVIGNNIALSLGMVGALSIVRFRTAIKDPRDTTYIFWAIAVGVCCGICDYLIAGIGSAVIFCMMVLIGNVRGNDRYLLIVRTSGTPDTRVEELMQSYYQNKARLRVKNTASQQSEYIYELSASVLNKHGGSEEISNELYALAGVQNVNLVCQNDEITA